MAVLDSFGDVRLIGDHNRQVSSITKPFDRLDNTWKNFRLFKGLWRIRSPFPDNRPVQYTVPVQKNSGTSSHHFVAFACKSG